MSIADRTASTVWEGSLEKGSGTVSSGSGALGSLPVTWVSRTEAPGGRTSPEELAAAAHSSCYSMALSLRLAENGVTADRLDVSATVTLDAVDGVPTVVSSAIEVSAVVPDASEATFQKAVDEASALCPISRLFAGASISVQARLEKA